MSADSVVEKTAAQGEYRIEHDTMGEVRVPADALWRAQTQRAVENFPISGRGLERAQIRALGLVKAAAARVNGKIGVLERALAEAIAAAADRVAAGEPISSYAPASPGALAYARLAYEVEARFAH